MCVTNPGVNRKGRSFRASQGAARKRLSLLLLPARFRKFGDTPPWQARDTHPTSLVELINMPYTKTGNS